jgi:hypothetical protein
VNNYVINNHYCHTNAYHRRFQTSLITTILKLLSHSAVTGEGHIIAGFELGVTPIIIQNYIIDIILSNHSHPRHLLMSSSLNSTTPDPTLDPNLRNRRRPSSSPPVRQCPSWPRLTAPPASTPPSRPLASPPDASLPAPSSLQIAIQSTSSPCLNTAAVRCCTPAEIRLATTRREAVKQRPHVRGGAVEMPPVAAPLRHAEEIVPRCCHVGDEAFDAPTQR